MKLNFLKSSSLIAFTLSFAGCLEWAYVEPDFYESTQYHEARYKTKGATKPTRLVFHNPANALLKWGARLLGVVSLGAVGVSGVCSVQLEQYNTFMLNHPMDQWINKQPNQATELCLKQGMKWGVFPSKKVQEDLVTAIHNDTVSLPEAIQANNQLLILAILYDPRIKDSVINKKKTLDPLKYTANPVYVSIKEKLDAHNKQLIAFLTSPKQINGKFITQVEKIQKDEEKQKADQKKHNEEQEQRKKQLEDLRTKRDSATNPLTRNLYDTQYKSVEAQLNFAERAWRDQVAYRIKPINLEIPYINLVPRDTKLSGLVSAINTQNLSLVKYLLNEGAEFEASDQALGMRPLDFAVVNYEPGKDEFVKALLDKMDAVNNEPNLNGHTTLELASMAGDEKLVALLIQKGANFSRSAKGGGKALINAILSGSTELAKAYIKEGADVNYSDSTPIIMAINADMFDMVYALVEVGASLAGGVLELSANKNPQLLAGILERVSREQVTNVNMDDPKYLNSLFEGVVLVKEALALKSLLDHGFAFPAALGPKLLYKAVSMGSLDTARVLLEDATVDPNATYTILAMDYPPLEMAIMNNNIPMVQLLLDHGANKNALSSLGEPLINTASPKVKAVLDTY